MNKKTLKALRGSIEKWEKIVAKEGVDRYSNNCPLCQTCGECDGCPVALKTELPGCSGSPYEEWDVHLDEEHHNMARKVHCPTCEVLARKEVEFLKSLLPNDTKDRKEAIMEDLRGRAINTFGVDDG